MKWKHVLARWVGGISPAALRLASHRAARKAVDISYAARAIDVTRRSDGAVIRLNSAQAVYLPDMINFFTYYFDSVHPVITRTSDG